MIERSYSVTGMSCAHCVRAVSDALGGLTGVAAVAVDLATGTVVITSTATLDGADVAAAIDEAGYALVA